MKFCVCASYTSRYPCTQWWFDIAASGGYFVAAAADRIYVNPSSLVGSIGVRMDAFGFVELMKKIGVERRLLTAGENKGLFDPFLPEQPEQKGAPAGHVERSPPAFHPGGTRWQG